MNKREHSDVMRILQDSYLITGYDIEIFNDSEDGDVIRLYTIRLSDSKDTSAFASLINNIRSKVNNHYRLNFQIFFKI